MWMRRTCYRGDGSLMGQWPSVRGYGTSINKNYFPKKIFSKEILKSLLSACFESLSLQYPACARVGSKRR